KSRQRCSTSLSSSSKLPSSSSRSTRSRAVSLPSRCCRSRRSSPPPASARRVRSRRSSSGQLSPGLVRQSARPPAAGPGAARRRFAGGGRFGAPCARAHGEDRQLLADRLARAGGTAHLLGEAAHQLLEAAAAAAAGVLVDRHLARPGLGAHRRLGLLPVLE